MAALQVPALPLSSTFDDVIIAERNLSRQFLYMELDDDGNEVGPIDLTDYTRLVYNIQTGDATPVEVLTVDSDDDPTWLTTGDDPEDGIIILDVPGSAIDWVASDKGNWVHELVLLDDNGGILSFFTGNVILKKPVTAIP